MAGLGKGRPSTREAAAIASTIRQAAITALMREGPGVTMAAIVAASGLTRKTVYARYANKDALFMAVIRDVVAESVPVAFDAAGGIEDRLAAFGRATLLMLRQPESVALQRLLTVNPDYPRALGHDLQAAVDQIFAAPLRACLAAAEAAGEVRVADLERAVEAIVTLLLARTAQALNAPAGTEGAWDDAAAADYACFVARFACHGLGVPPAPAPPEKG